MHSITIRGIETDIYDAFVRHAKSRPVSSGGNDAVASAAKDMVVKAATSQLASEGLLFPNAEDIASGLFSRPGDMKFVQVGETLGDLFRSGLVTYPKTSSRFLPDGAWKNVPSLIQSVATRSGAFTPSQIEGLMTLSRLCSDREPMRPGFRADPGDYHAIIPIDRTKEDIETAISSLKADYPFLPYMEVYAFVVNRYVNTIRNMLRTEQKFLEAQE